MLYGMPSAEKGGTAIKPYAALGISVDCEDKEGAWSFIRTFLYDQYQTKLAGRALPATKTGFDSIINDYMAWVSAGGRMHTIDPFGNDVTIQETDGRIADMTTSSQYFPQLVSLARSLCASVTVRTINIWAGQTVKGIYRCCQALTADTACLPAASIRMPHGSY